MSFNHRELQSRDIAEIGNGTGGRESVQELGEAAAYQR